MSNISQEPFLPVSLISPLLLTILNIFSLFKKVTTVSRPNPLLYAFDPEVLSLFPSNPHSPLHPVFAGVGLAFAPVLPAEERFVDTSKL